MKDRFYFQSSAGLGPLGWYAVHVLTSLPSGNSSVFELGKK